GGKVFKLLSGAGNIYAHGNQSVLGIPEEQGINIVVFISFEALKILPLGFPVHYRGPILVDSPAIVTYCGSFQAPGHTSPVTAAPGFHHGIRYSLREQISIVVYFGNAFWNRI